MVDGQDSRSDNAMQVRKVKETNDFGQTGSECLWQNP